MKKALTISAIIAIVILIIYVNVRIYQNWLLNTKPTSYNDALQAIKNPSFTIDVLPDNNTLPSIQTTLQTDLENLDPAIIDELMSQYSASSYDNFNDFYQGN